MLVQTLALVWSKKVPTAEQKNTWATIPRQNLGEMLGDSTSSRQVHGIGLLLGNNME